MDNGDCDKGVNIDLWTATATATWFLHSRPLVYESGIRYSAVSL